MAGERTLPGLGLTGFWTPGSDGWDTGMDANLRVLSALVNLSVISRTTVLPGSPADGDLYIVKVGETDALKVAIRDSGAWVYLPAVEGWRAWVEDDEEFVYFDGAAWVTEPGASDEIGINPQTGTTYTFVLTDSKKLVTADNAAAQTYTLPDNATTAFPVGTMISLKGLGAGAVTFEVAGTDTLNGVAGGGGDISAPWDTVTFTKLTTTGWSVDGAHEGIA